MLSDGAVKNKHNLPGYLTRLTDETTLVARLRNNSRDIVCSLLLDRSGIGKTSVGLAVAGEMMETFEHGAWLVDLCSGPLTDTSCPTCWGCAWSANHR